MTFSGQGQTREILYYENFNITDLVTPVNAKMLKLLLLQAKYDKEEIDFLVEGFSNGFSIGYEGKTDVKVKAHNLKFQVGDEIILWNKVMKEVKEKRYAGPFTQIPFEYYIQSPIGLVEKDHGKDFRLIFHLSYPRKENSTSVNANTPAELCSVQYPDFSEAINLFLQEGEKCHISRSDVKMAFRNLGVMRKHWQYLVMKVKSPFDKKFYYFFDKCLAFGASISCTHFQRFSQAISHLVTYHTGKKNVAYLDDFLFTALLKAICDGQIHVFMDICNQINLPVNIDKTFWGTTTLVFLGLLIDTVRMLVLVPVEKVAVAREMIDSILSKRSNKITLNQLQKICGFLNFLGRCIVPGRAFTR